MEEQRGACSEFMRRREFSRRINTWIQDYEEDEPIYATSPSLAAARNNHWAGASSSPTPTRATCARPRARPCSPSLSSVAEESI
ncbi:hypothetical protein PHLGIDRAFT_115250 [Phlebiopsis gigantea 11061_1 CR5-6]|uniref:Uncharacterized protein n=1 Tax=Phlebiopsis gigantea (strain 11061_1 CR5-6) TaxID=745531 RepID=A0A0C3SC88_PHLG1|nr:hypothetical protein PHLGIDRAFT_115250 [Phlebiopsis gigantea 11061_1 CR5-6]